MKNGIPWDRSKNDKRRERLPFTVFFYAVKEALIKSLSDFILGFLCNARNNSTPIASYLRQQSCIGLLSQDKLALSLHIKAPSFYSWPIYDEAVHKNPYEI